MREQRTGVKKRERERERIAFLGFHVFSYGTDCILLLLLITTYCSHTYSFSSHRLPSLVIRRVLSRSLFTFLRRCFLFLISRNACHSHWFPSFGVIRSFSEHFILLFFLFLDIVCTILFYNLVLWSLYHFFALFLSIFLFSFIIAVDVFVFSWTTFSIPQFGGEYTKRPLGNDSTSRWAISLFSYNWWAAKGSRNRSRPHWHWRLYDRLFSIVR